MRNWRCGWYLENGHRVLTRAWLLDRLVPQRYASPIVSILNTPYFSASWSNCKTRGNIIAVTDAEPQGWAIGSQQRPSRCYFMTSEILKAMSGNTDIEPSVLDSNYMHWLLQVLMTWNWNETLIGRLQLNTVLQTLSNVFQICEDLVWRFRVRGWQPWSRGDPACRWPLLRPCR